ncbi:hypothetical protein C6P42_003040 [Pichia californica]|nr:hypothetical protein C6P42_003040 [[Candida] californica]
MDISTDKVFVQAVATIKSLTDLSKTTGLPRPSINDRLNLYGLYNQSTRGDVTILNTDPNSITNPTELKKYNAWLKFIGLTKSQARKKYILYLLNILNTDYLNNENSDLMMLKTNLEDSWNILEDYSNNKNININNINNIHNITKQPLQPRIPLSFNSTPITPELENINVSSLVSPITDVPVTIENSNNFNHSGDFFNNNSNNNKNNNNNSIPLLNSNNSHVNINRMQSPAASLYRIASSGINSNIIKPPSRNQSIKSRQNSFSGSMPLPSSSNNISLLPVNSNINQSIPSSNMNTNTNTNTNTNMINNNINNGNVNVIEFVKWQSEINNTLLKISTELSNLKMNNNISDSHRSISGSTTVSVQSDIQNYKLRTYDYENSEYPHSNNNNNSNNNLNNVSKYSFDYKKLRVNHNENNHSNGSFDNNSTISNDEDKKDLIEWIYLKMIKLINYLKNKLHLKINIDSIYNGLLKSVIALFFLSIFKKLIEIYINKRFGIKLISGSNRGSLVQYWKQWMMGLLSGKSGVNVLA